MFTPTQIKQGPGPSKRGLASKKKEKEILPPRKSSRLSGGKVPEIQRYEPILSTPVEEKEIPLHSLPLEDTYAASHIVSLEDTRHFLTSLSKETNEKSSVSFS